MACRRLATSILAVLATGSVTQAQWSQAGGALTSTPAQSGIVGQGYTTEPAEGGGLRLQSGFLAHHIFRTNAPFVVAPISDRRVAMGFQSIRIPLDDIFTDIDGDSLGFRTEVDGSVATGLVSGDTLVVSGVQGSSGSATFHITAADATDSVTASFRLVVEPSTAIKREAAPAKPVSTPDIRVTRVIADIPVGDRDDGFLGRDGRNDATDGLGIDILLPGPATVSVSIFDNMGTPVIAWSEEIGPGVLMRIAPEPDGRKAVAVRWNLRTQDGHRVASGVYLWKIVARTSTGEKLEWIRRLGVKEDRGGRP